MTTIPFPTGLSCGSLDLVQKKEGFPFISTTSWVSDWNSNRVLYWGESHTKHHVRENETRRAFTTVLWGKHQSWMTNRFFNEAGVDNWEMNVPVAISIQHVLTPQACNTWAGMTPQKHKSNSEGSYTQRCHVYVDYLMTTYDSKDCNSQENPHGVPLIGELVVLPWNVIFLKGLVYLGSGWAPDLFCSNSFLMTSPNSNVPSW